MSASPSRAVAILPLEPRPGGPDTTRCRCCCRRLRHIQPGGYDTQDPFCRDCCPNHNNRPTGYRPAFVDWANGVTYGAALAEKAEAA